MPFLYKSNDGRVSLERIYILAKVDVNHREKVMEDLFRIPEVKVVDSVTGPFDLVISAEGPDMARLLSSTLKRVGEIEGIKSTETLVAINLD
jgi:Lrp/AsnC family transcriptional regulator for asnA, asnC and gidA